MHIDQSGIENFTALRTLILDPVEPEYLEEDEGTERYYLFVLRDINSPEIANLEFHCYVNSLKDVEFLPLDAIDGIIQQKNFKKLTSVTFNILWENLDWSLCEVICPILREGLPYLASKGLVRISFNEWPVSKL